MDAILGLAGFLSLTSLAIYAITATRRAGDEKAARTGLTEQLKAANANTATESKRADFQEKRANALDAAIARAAAAAVGPIAGSFAKLLEEVAEYRASHPGGEAAGVVRDAGSASGAGPSGAARAVDSDLLKPGE